MSENILEHSIKAQGIFESLFKSWLQGITSVYLNQFDPFLDQVPLPVEAVEDAEWRGRELPDCGAHVLDVPHGGPLTSLVMFRQ